MSDQEDPATATMVIAPGAVDALISAPKARLRCRNASLLKGGPGAEILLDGANVTLGRGPENTVALQADGISRKHARFYPGENGWRIEDQGSTNGIRVNGKNVDKADLAHNDEVVIGAVTFDFSVDSEVEASRGDTQPTVAFQSIPEPPPPTPEANDASAAGAPPAQKATPTARPAARPSSSGGSNILLWVIVLAGAGALVFAVYSVLI